MREEVWTIVRAAVDEALKPVLAKQRELEGMLADRERELAEALAPEKVRALDARTAPLAMPQPPVAMPPPIAPVPVSAPPAPIPLALATAALPLPAAMPRIEPALPIVDGPPRPRMKSLPPTGFGVSVVRASKPDIDLEALAKLPVEMDGFDGGKKKMMVAKVILVILFVAMIVAVVASVMSHR